MNSTTTLVTAIACTAIAAIIGIHLWSSAPAKSAATPHTATAPVAGVDQEQFQDGATTISLRPSHAAQAVAAGSLLGTKGAIAKLAISHPELQLDEATIAALQVIFSRHYRAFAAFEAEMATATPNQDGSVTIQIPAFPREAATLLDDFLDDVAAHYRGKTPMPVREALQRMYAGYTNELGTAGLDLTVRISEDPNYAYDLSRKVVFMENGRVVAVGETTAVLTRERVSSSPYAEISKYFPKVSS